MIFVFSAKNEAKNAASIQEVTGLADSYDSPIICAELKVSKLGFCTSYTQSGRTLPLLVISFRYTSPHISRFPVVGPNRVCFKS